MYVRTKYNNSSAINESLRSFDKSYSSESDRSVLNITHYFNSTYYLPMFFFQMDNDQKYTSAVVHYIYRNIWITVFKQN